MNYQQGLYPILEKKNLSKNCYDFLIHCPDITALAQAGQFVHIRVNGFSLRRPISICGIDRANGNLRLVFEVRGEGTNALAQLARYSMIDLMGPLGHGFSLLEEGKRVIVVGGGIGTPPLLPVAAHYGKNATAILGFRSADAVILEQDFAAVGAKTLLCTDDGSAGKHGFVTAVLEEQLQTSKPDLICACGPSGMLKAVVTQAEHAGIPCEVSLEERMGCGVGACLVCACKTVKDGKEFFSHVCKDGPVFNSEHVVF